MENEIEKKMEKTGVPIQPVNQVPQVAPAKPKKQPKPKYKSRATRCGEAAGSLNMPAEGIRGISEEITALREEFEEALDPTEPEEEGVVSSEPTGYLDKETTNKILELINKVSANFSDVETTKGDFEGLQEEMESWRDGMQGTNLESTDKYSRVEEASQQPLGCCIKP
jgi:hypothetical protein